MIQPNDWGLERGDEPDDEELAQDRLDKRERDYYERADYEYERDSDR
jgi:hypothetical protein